MTTPHLPEDDAAKLAEIEAAAENTKDTAPILMEVIKNVYDAALAKGFTAEQSMALAQTYLSSVVGKTKA